MIPHMQMEGIFKQRKERQPAEDWMKSEPLCSVFIIMCKVCSAGTVDIFLLFLTVLFLLYDIFF